MLEKRKRIESRKTLDEYQLRPCDSCGAPPPNDPAHIRSKGSGGPDLPFNLLSLCRKCHTEQHQYGWEKFVNWHPKALNALKNKGWVLTEIFGFKNLHHPEFFVLQNREPK